MSNKITCVIPVYNSEEYILATLNSIKNQIKKFDEILIINDNSEDSSLEIINYFIQENKELDIELINLYENKGVSYARNIGVKKSRNKNIVFLDSDDVLDEKFLYEYLKVLNTKYIEFAMIHSSYIQIDESDKVLSKEMTSKKFSILDGGFGDLIIRNTISTSGVLINKDKFLKVGGFNVDYHLSEDWDLWLRILHEGDILYIDKPLTYIRRHTNNSSKNLDSMLNSEKKILRKYKMNYIKKNIYMRSNGKYRNSIDYIGVLVKLRHYSAAEQEIERILEYDISDDYYDDLLFLLGVIKYYQFEYISALEIFKSIKRTDIASLNNIGCIYCILGMFNKAEEYLYKSYAMNKNYIDASKNLKFLRGIKDEGYKDIEIKKICSSLNFTSRKLREELTIY